MLLLVYIGLALVDSLRACMLAVVLVAAYSSELIITTSVDCHCTYDTNPFAQNGKFIVSYTSICYTSRVACERQE